MYKEMVFETLDLNKDGGVDSQEFRLAARKKYGVNADDNVLLCTRWLSKRTSAPRAAET